MRLPGYRSRLAALAVGLTLIAAAPGAVALEPLVKKGDIPGSLTANVAIANDYIFRGISQTDNRPAIQGGIDYEVGIGSGLKGYLGVWGSNVHFADASVEFDLAGGVRGTSGKLGWDIGFIYYAYPGANSALDYDFIEAQVSGTYDFGPVALKAGLNFAPDYFASSGPAFYPAVDVEIPIGKFVKAMAHLGYQVIDDNADFGTEDYVDYSIGIGVNLLGFDATLKWTDTDLPDSQCDDLCGVVLLSLAKSF